MRKNDNNTLKVVTSVAGAILLVISLLGSFTLISPGQVGIVFNTMTGSLNNVSQGLVFKVPFVTHVQSYPVSLRTYTMVKRQEEGSSKPDDSVDLPTKEGQHIKQDISITYNTSDNRASDVFKSFQGADIEAIENTFIRRTTITVAQNVAGQMSLSELISSGRSVLQSEIQKSLSIELNKMGFNLDKVNLGASHLPEAIEAQMQQKMAAQQLALQAEYELQKNETLAKAQVAKARGNAEAAVVEAEGQSRANRKLLETLTSLLIEYKKVEKWNGVQPQVVGGHPMISISPKGE